MVAVKFRTDVADHTVHYVSPPYENRIGIFIVIIGFLIVPSNNITLSTHEAVRNRCEHPIKSEIQFFTVVFKGDVTEKQSEIT